MSNKKSRTSSLMLSMVFLVFFLSVYKNVAAQSFNYGLEVGIGAFNEKWTSDMFPLKGWGKDKAGLTLSVFGAINHSRYFSTRFELGYMNKGSINEMSFEMPDGTIEKGPSYRTDLKTFKLGISERISFLESRFRPFIDIGFNVQYVPEKEIENRAFIYMGPEGVAYIFQGYEWNKVTFNGSIGIGVIYNELVYFKIGYNHPFTKLLDEKGVEVIDRALVGSVGLNINELVRLF